MNSFVCTLFEGHYHCGAAGLINSLYAAGFRGKVFLGYRGSVPPWANNHSDRPFECAPGLTLQFIPIAHRTHFTNYKPVFMKRLFEQQAPDAEAGFYFDPDIVVRGHWTFFTEWVRHGVALCEDVFPRMPATHPLRAQWRAQAAALGLSVHRQMDNYLNGGFVGLLSRNRGFLEIWSRLLQSLGPDVLEQYSVPDKSNWDHKPDQELLNATAMVAPEPLSIVGPEGMDFLNGGGRLMVHGIGKPKPWCKHMVWRTLLSGSRPTHADREFYKHTSNPIRIFTPAQLLVRRFDLRLACAFGRFLN